MTEMVRIFLGCVRYFAPTDVVRTPYGRRTDVVKTGGWVSFRGHRKRAKRLRQKRKEARAPGRKSRNKRVGSNTSVEARANLSCPSGREPYVSGPITRIKISPSRPSASQTHACFPPKGQGSDPHELISRYLVPDTHTPTLVGRPHQS